MLTEWRRVIKCHECGEDMNFFNPLSGQIGVHRCKGKPTEQEEQEPCANCGALTSEYDEGLRRYLHDACKGEYLFGE